jgi:hypothetical protein
VEVVDTTEAIKLPVQLHICFLNNVNLEVFNHPLSTICIDFRIFPNINRYVTDRVRIYIQLLELGDAERGGDKESVRTSQ